MTRLIIALTLVAIATTANAITDYSCLSDCMGRGRLYKDCMLECTSDKVQPGTLQATFTGQSELIRTANGFPAYKCAYNLNGQTIVKIFAQPCPSTTDVRLDYDISKQPTPPSPPPPPPPPSPQPSAITPYLR